MRARLGQVLYCAAGSGAALLLSSCVSLVDLPSDLQQSAQCVAAALTATPGISDVGLSASTGETAGKYAVIRYSFIDSARKRHTVRFGLYSDSRIESGHVFIDAEAAGFGESSEGSPANTAAWEGQCGATGLLITA